MASTKKRESRVVRAPAERTADSGKVRIGDGWITAEFPPLRRPSEKTVDTGTIRIGDGWITSGFSR
jgi:hypothetical protein